jgi:cellobiose phosphorylase
MAGIGKETGEALKSMESTRKYLLGEYGVEVLTPCYTRYHKELGEISSYPPGFKENGSVFCHNNPWIACAEAAIGRGNEAFDIYKRICPAYLEDKSEIHEAEPYCYSQTVTGRASGNPGHAKNSWLTGTASWTFVSISQAILGVKPDYNGLIVDPCIPDELGEFTVTRRFRGCNYIIHVKHTGERSLSVDGKAVSGKIIPLQEKAEVLVEATV